MSNQTTLIPASKVEGNITSCKIEQQVKSVQKDSVWSTQQRTTYITYDVCNKNVVAEYVRPEFAPSGVIVVTMAVVVVGSLLIGLIRAIKWDGKDYSNPFDRYY